MSIIKQMFTINSNGDQRAGILYVPDDYNKLNSYPLLVFSHGVGETGDGTLNTVNLLFNNGSPLAVANNGNKMAFVSPYDNKTYEYIVLGLQGIQSWCCQAAESVYVIQNDIQKNYSINPNAIYKTGLSAGGEVTWEGLGGANASLFAAGVPMSPAIVNLAIMSYANVANNHTKVWAFHGLQDTGLTAYWNSLNDCQQVETLNPGSTHLTSFNGGHCCWATYYDPGYKETFTVNGKVGSYNIYEIMLAAMKGNSFSFLTPTNSTTTTTTTTQKMAALTAVLAASTTGNTVNLTGFNSIGPIGSWWITITGRPTGAPNPWWDNGRGDGGAGLPSTIVKGMTNVVDGMWTFTLSIQSPSGQVVTSAPVSVVVAASTAPVVTITFQHIMADGKTLTIFSDFTYTIV